MRWGSYLEFFSKIQHQKAWFSTMFFWVNYLIYWILYLKGYGIQKIEMWIFDRWGKQVFYSENLSAGWDGKEMDSKNPLPQGIYVYKIRITDYKNIEKDYFGFVNLIR